MPLILLAATTSVYANTGALINSNSGKCMDDPGSSNGVKMIQWDCYGGSNQDWYQGTSYSDGSVDLRNNTYNKCLDVPNWSTSNGTQLQIWSCTGGSNQRFYSQWSGGYLFRFKNVNSGKCVEVYNWSTSNGGIIDQWTCSDTLQYNQEWQY